MKPQIDTDKRENFFDSDLSLWVKFVVSIVFFAAIFFAANIAEAQKIAVLRVGETGVKFHEKFRGEIAKQNSLQLVDDDLSRAAFRALNLQNPFNLSLEEARDLGAAIECRFYLLIKSDTVRRSSFKKDVYFESFARVFLVSARTGRLAAWESIAREADAGEQAEKSLLAETEQIWRRFADSIQKTEAAERAERDAGTKKDQFIELSGQTTAESENIRTPLPYRSLKPAYTEAAQRADVEAAVEVAIELNVNGTVENAEIQRWAGFGLDEATLENVRKMQFRPALRNGTPVSARFVLRYNFRRLR